MNVLLLSLAYHPDAVNAVQRLSRDGLQNQINAFQWALIHGMRQALEPGETLSVLNSLPVGVYPKHYRGLFLPGGVFSGNFTEIGGVNLPWLKQRGRKRQARQALARWAAGSPENRTILIYTLYLPYLKAVIAVKKKFPGMKAVVIVTDLPNELGISSGRKGMLKKIETSFGKESATLCRAMDGFVLLTAPMAEALKIMDKPRMVMEGLVSETESPETAVDTPADSRPAVLYSGTLNRELGIPLLLEAFQGMGEAQLWLCGGGDMEKETKQAAEAFANIRYFGYVPRETALALQKKASALINPRTAENAFTRYSFPSKTLEYMRSGKPVLCCKLEGIPAEYDDYLLYIEPQTADGIYTAVRKLLALPAGEREAIGGRARRFALENKSAAVQSGRLLAFLRGL
jgi:glycosyltransferase involved in cell wall biosynthesis